MPAGHGSDRLRGGLVDTAVRPSRRGTGGHRLGVGKNTASSPRVRPGYLNHRRLPATGPVTEGAALHRLPGCCPTGLVQPGQRTSRLAYLTQTKQMVPEPTGKDRQRLYGCDTCQVVCPKTGRTSPPAGIPAGSGKGEAPAEADSRHEQPTVSPGIRGDGRFLAGEGADSAERDHRFGPLPRPFGGAPPFPAAPGGSPAGNPRDVGLGPGQNRRRRCAYGALRSGAGGDGCRRAAGDRAGPRPPPAEEVSSGSPPKR